MLKKMKGEKVGFFQGAEGGWEETNDTLLAALDALQKNETTAEAVAASEPSVWCSEAMRSGPAICGSEALRSSGLSFHRDQCGLDHGKVCGCGRPLHLAADGQSHKSKVSSRHG